MWLRSCKYNVKRKKTFSLRSCEYIDIRMPNAAARCRTNTATQWGVVHSGTRLGSIPDDKPYQQSKTKL